ncbi:MAG: EamA family transporter [bacterium]|nr:EamA family transporter [bacterium]
MSTWFLFALIGPLLWAVVNHIDKYMLFKYFKQRGVESLLVFSCLSSVLVLPIIVYFFHGEIFNVSLFSFLILLSIGFLSAIGFYFYLKAVDLEEISIVIPLFQLLPIFTYFLGYFILGESLNTQQIFASLLIMLGAFVLSLELDIDRTVLFKRKAFFLVAISSLCYALNDVLFKKVALVESFWISVFWQYLGLFLFGLFLVVFYKKFRKAFRYMFVSFNTKTLLLNLLSEVLYMIGNLASNFAILSAPVVLVLVVGSSQPLFVFVGAIIMTIVLPKIVTERISKGHMIHRVLCIIVMLIGSYLLYTSSN